MKKFFKYIRDAIKELSFVTWPKNDILIRHSIIVLCVTLVFAAGFWLMDGGLRSLVGQFILTTEPFRGSGSTMTGTTLPTTIPTTDLGNIQVNGAGLPEGVQVTPITTPTTAQ